MVAHGEILPSCTVSPGADCDMVLRLADSQTKNSTNLTELSGIGGVSVDNWRNVLRSLSLIHI